MAWRYDQVTGILLDPKGFQVAVGYAGKGEGENNPSMEAVRGVGPIPRGLYKIGKAYAHPVLGVFCMNLDPIGHSALGRTLFRIHGDNTQHTASRGCVILARAIRIMIDASQDKELLVG